MPAAARWLLLAGFALSLATVLVLPGTRDAATPRAHAVLNEDFRGNDGPTKLYELDSSHNQIADANPAEGGTTGYCIDVQNADIQSVGANVGFSAVNGTVVDADFFDSGTPQTQDDFYCAVVVADALPDDELNGEMTLEWTYTDNPGSADQRPRETIELDIDVFRVELESVDGIVGGAGEVCTVNWDPAILTGAASNLPPSGESVGSLPDPRDEIQLGADPDAGNADGMAALDWHITQGSPGATLDKLGMFKDGNEWCLTLSADAVTSGLTVELNFDAIYNRSRNADDQHHAEQTTLDFIDVDYSELRHISPGGQIISSATSPLNVIGSRHYVCVLPSDASDGDSISNVQIQPEPATGLSIFSNDPDEDFAGVPENTLCFSWRSSQVGSQTVQAFVDFDDPDRESNVFWDTNGDGNGDPDMENAPLVKRWGAFERTELTQGGNPNLNLVTNSSISTGVAFNVADGTYSAGSIGITEWVIGRDGDDPPPDPREVEDPGELPIPPLLDGVPLVAKITSQCGYFEAETSAGDEPRVLHGVSVGGRFDLDPNTDQSGPGTDGDGRPFDPDGLPDDISMSINNDSDCTPRKSIELEVRAYNPGADLDSDDAIHTETLSVTFERSTPEITPRVAWVGQEIQTTFAFGGGCDPYHEATINFSVSDDAPGSFLPSSSVSLDGPKSANGTFSADEREDQEACSFTVGYESENPGEVAITASFSGVEDVENPGRIDTTKSVFPVFFMAIEDVQLGANEDVPVSARGDVSAQVRGWFPSSNPSGREAQTYENGNTVPADRWVLPDDWSQLRGDSDFRVSWPGSPSMPPTEVTFFMENEDVENTYPDTPDEPGAAGWFLLDGGEYSLDVNPRTEEPSALGSEFRPRIISDTTDSSGVASVDVIGDLNLTYEDCPVNTPTGNPHCDLDDVVGSSTYYAIAEYPEERNLGKWPPRESNTATTNWRWLGYKDVTILDTDVPSQKYIVAHLKDRDGFCDGVFQHNTLGVEVEFEMDSEAGRIVEVAGEPSILPNSLRSAVGTTFDTHDASGNEVNVDIVKPTLSSDECQAWIRVSNSLLKPMNVLVEFPAQPAPVPGDLRITDLQCTGDESFTVTNTGDNPVSLDGFSVRSLQQDIIQPEEHLDLTGLLEPGQSATFYGWPRIEEQGWQFVGGPAIFDEGAIDYARLVWNDFEIHRVECDGDEFVNEDLPDPLPADGEGEILLDVIVPFGEDTAELSEGWNLVTAGTDDDVEAALGGRSRDVTAVYGFREDDRGWDRYIVDTPEFVNTLETFEAGAVYWVYAERAFTLQW